MATSHIKRIRMHRPTSGWRPACLLPHGYHWQPWDDSLLDTHAGMMFLCFTDTIDAELFPNFACLSGCRLLVRWMRECESFCPQATWLITNSDIPIGMIQGNLEGTYGGIQNVGVRPEFRRKGFGTLLLAKALEGFTSTAATTVTLEVTANNPNALRLYRRSGFKPYNSYFRRLERTSAAPSGRGTL